MSKAQMFDPHQPIKPQPTFKGYNHWVIWEVMDAKGITPAEAVAWIVDRWVDSNRTFLEEEFGLSRDRYKRELAEAKVKRFPVRESESG